MNTIALAPTAPLSGYYRWHARFYDITRWAFLFGRYRLIQKLAKGPVPRRVLEIGCGTGKNLTALARVFSGSEIVGLDLSEDMLDRARPKLTGFGSRISLLQQAYEFPVGGEKKFDLIVFSYSLSMINPGYDKVLKIAQLDLAPGGRMAVVDFHKSRWAWFRSWMRVNHVRMEGQLLAALQRDFDVLRCEIRGAYFGLWKFMIFVGGSRGGAERWKF